MPFPADMKLGHSGLNKWLASALDEVKGCQDSHELLAKLTLVIPCYGRQDFVLRQIAYWGCTAAQLVIVDGSPQPLRAETLEIFAGRENIKYHYLPDSIYVRLRFASLYIHTPYAVLLGDDEFFLKRGLCRAIEILEQNPALVACAGQSLKFYAKMDGAAITYGHSYSYCRYAVPQGTIAERLRFAMANYNAVTCYAVLREPAWSHSWGSAQPWTHIPASEIQQAVVTYIHGKVATVDEVMWLRSSEHEQVKIKGVWEPDKITFSDWWFSEDYTLERESFVQAMIDEAVTCGGLDRTQAREAILEAMHAYLDFCSHQSPPLRWTSLMSDIIKKIKLMAGVLLRLFLGQKQVRSLMSLTKVHISGEYGNLDALRCNQESLPYLRHEELYVELCQIEEFITNFYRARLRVS